MRSKRGFTLVELLVVMAIIAILASIVVPNVARYIAKARVTRALSEIKSIELALTKMLTDCDRSSLQHLFDPDDLRVYIGYVAGDGFSPPGAAMTTAQFQAAQRVYRNTFYALLREGRAVLTDFADVEDYTQFLNAGVVRKLGISYLDIEFDPWGTMYQIFPGPWPSSRRVNGVPVNPIPFRTYLVDESQGTLPGSRGSGRPDGWELPNVLDPDTDESLTIGYPGSRDRIAFIYSHGPNLVSGQMVYQPSFDNASLPPYDVNNPETMYAGGQDYILMGGGDDISNWDNGRSWERFTN